jgi:hypothetical protein
LLTIRGHNFLSIVDPSTVENCGYPVIVYIGEQLCPQARIMDDSVILAVCAPFQLPANLDAPGTYLGTRRRSLDAAYAPVIVCGPNKSGLLTTSEASVYSIELPDGSHLLSTPSRFNVEYHFPGYTVKDGASLDKGSDAEFELPDETLPATVPVVQPTSQAPTVVDWKLSAKLVKKGFDAWTAQHGSPPAASEGQAAFSTQSVAIVESMSTSCAFASDAALLEDVGMKGLPYLSGTCRGFGFDLTDEFPRRTNENSKP